MRVIGTAGHVDHGKSTLIAALTGTHPDRLKEEQAREMTIDLGFGWLTLPDGEEVGIVDVPGHRDFIENMLAGVGGIDAALLVIAVDEGVMPQTREHLAILDLLQVPAGIIVITKVDLIQDPEWLLALEADVRIAVKGTVFSDAPIVQVSARNRTGLSELLAALTSVLGAQPPRPDLQRPRLPIDRVFTMSGFGTVVTGTLTDGCLSLGDEVQVLPGGTSGRIRGLQTHKKKEGRASPGSRTAVNVSGIPADKIRRGQVLAHPDTYAATRRLDARFRLLADVAVPVVHNMEVKVFIGTSEATAILRLLGTEQLPPGEEAWIQLELREPLVAVRGDRYILRRPSPAVTLGGGLIIDPHPKARHKRFDAGVTRSLESLRQGSPADILHEASLALRVATAGEVIERSQLESQQAREALAELVEAGTLLWLDEAADIPPQTRLIITSTHFQELSAKVLDMLQSYHARFPLRRGMPREELKSRLGAPPRVFNSLMIRLLAQAEITEAGNTVASRGHAISMDAVQEEKARALLDRFTRQPYSPPSLKDCQDEAGDELVNALIERGDLTAISMDVLFRTEDYDVMVARLKEVLAANGRITLAEVRDLFNTSRKYAQALLEHLDAKGLTRRVDDFRVLR